MYRNIVINTPGIKLRHRLKQKAKGNLFFFQVVDVITQCLQLVLAWDSTGRNVERSCAEDVAQVLVARAQFLGTRQSVLFLISQRLHFSFQCFDQLQNF